MSIGGKRILAAAGAAALMIGGSAAVTELSSENEPMQLSISVTSHTAAVSSTATTASTAIEAEAPPIEIYPQYSSTVSATAAPQAEPTSAVATTADTSCEPDDQYADTVIVYVSAAGKYHTRSDCSGMKNSTAMDITLAQSAGNIPCSRCCDDISAPVTSVQQAAADMPIIADDVVVYVSASGKYHSRSDCSGMKNYTEMGREAAEDAGHTACKKCW